MRSLSNAPANQRRKSYRSLLRRISSKIFVVTASTLPLEFDYAGVVDQKVHRHLGIQPRRAAPERCERLAHSGQITEQRHARRIGHQHPAEAERNLLRASAAVEPALARRPRGAISKPRARHA